MKKLLSLPAANAAVGSHNNYFTYVNELSHPLPREPPIVSPEEAVACIKSGKLQWLLPPTMPNFSPYSVPKHSEVIKIDSVM